MTAYYEINCGSIVTRGNFQVISDAKVELIYTGGFFMVFLLIVMMVIMILLYSYGWFSPFDHLIVAISVLVILLLYSTSIITFYYLQFNSIPTSLSLYTYHTFSSYQSIQTIFSYPHSNQSPITLFSSTSIFI